MKKLTIITAVLTVLNVTILFSGMFYLNNKIAAADRRAFNAEVFCIEKEGAEFPDVEKKISAVLCKLSYPVYATIVEMDEATFREIEANLDATSKDQREAETRLDGLIDVKDWQDDEFHSLVSCEEFNPKGN